MNEMHELITVDAFERALVIACWSWFGVCDIIAMFCAAQRQRQAQRVWLVAALLGPLVLALWKFYSWMVRVVPETGYVGLHKVSVAAICLLVFVGVGVAVGLGFRRMQHKA